jgi:hypothetical protein
VETGTKNPPRWRHGGLGTEAVDFEARVDFIEIVFLHTVGNEKADA